MDSFPPQVVAAWGAIIAALIAGVFSYLNLVISKEQKVSEFRQAWINELRQEISRYVAAIIFLAQANDTWEKDTSRTVAWHDHFMAMQPSVDSASVAYTSIVLRLNPEDPDQHLGGLNSTFLSTLESCRTATRESRYGDARTLADQLQVNARPILKAEWERVKSGEPVYRWTKRIAATLFVASVLAGVYVLTRGTVIATPPTGTTVKSVIPGPVFELVGKIGPFCRGEQRKTCPLKDSSESHRPAAIDTIFKTEDIIRKMISGAQTRTLVQIVVVGSTDRIELLPGLQTTYGSNQGLARARADWAWGQISDAWKQRGAKTVLPQPLVLTVGPAIHGPGKNSEDDTASDRTVSIYSLYQSDKPIQ